MILKNYSKLKFWLKKCIETATGYRVRYHNPYWSKEKILLTFDDGPVPPTLDILDLLDKYNKKAVFFVVAENVKKYPQIAREIVKRGHMIGSHGLIHSSMKKLSLFDFSHNIRESFRIIEEACGVKTKYFRPPFGQIGFIQAIWTVTHGVILFFWSCSISQSGAFDFINTKFKSEKNTGLDKSGLIVLLHDHAPLNSVESGLKFFSPAATK